MVERINFIEKEPFRLTYQRIAQIGGGVIGACFLFYALLLAREKWNEKRIDALQKEISSLDQERMAILKTSAPKLEGGPMAALKTVFLQTPQWSDLINDVGSRLPADVWLESLSAHVKDTQATDKNEAKKDKPEKTEPEHSKGLVITGAAQNLNSVAHFVQALDHSPNVEKPRLTSSEKRETSFIFTVECDIVGETH